MEKDHGFSNGDAEIQRTTIEIGHEEQTPNFNTVGEVIKFDGFLRIYNTSNLDNKTDNFQTFLLMKN